MRYLIKGKLSFRRALFCCSGLNAPYLLTLLSFFGFQSECLANPLLGRVETVLNDPRSAARNPGSAAFFRGVQATSDLQLLDQDTVKVRYPGFESRSYDQSRSATPANLVPAVTWRAGNRWTYGISRIVIPWDIELGMQDLPLVFLDQITEVNLDIKIRTTLGFRGLVAYRIRPDWGVGLDVSHFGFKLEIDADSTETGEGILDLVTEREVTAIGIGSRWRPGPNLSFGISASLFELSSQKTSFDSSLIGVSNESENADDDLIDSSAFLNRVSIAGRIRYLDSMQLLGETQIQVPKGSESFSPVELRKKTRDEHLRATVQLGHMIDLNRRWQLLQGLAYFPSRVGSGGRGDGSSTGFSAVDLARILLGTDSLEPYTLLGLGARFRFGKRSGSRQPFILDFGMTLQRASLGIDGDGEQPGAFLQEKLTLPIRVTWRS